jgi:hypothetical protein
VHIHLGHHFYGAGNLGDDFMLAGFLIAMRSLAPSATFTCCVPFALEPIRQRFPAIVWMPCDEPTRSASIAACDVWLGLGGEGSSSILFLAGSSIICVLKQNSANVFVNRCSTSVWVCKPHPNSPIPLCAESALKQPLFGRATPPPPND